MFVFYFERCNDFDLRWIEMSGVFTRFGKLETSRDQMQPHRFPRIVGVLLLPDVEPPMHEPLPKQTVLGLRVCIRLGSLRDQKVLELSYSPIPQAKILGGVLLFVAGSLVREPLVIRLDRLAVKLDLDSRVGRVPSNR